VSVYLRIAPGVKIRIGRRGRVRWSVWPRWARLHTGGGYRSAAGVLITGCGRSGQPPSTAGHGGQATGQVRVIVCSVA